MILMPARAAIRILFKLRHAAVLLAALLLFTSSGHSFNVLPPCELRNEYTAWLESAAVTWHKISEKDLGLKRVPLPWLVLFDESCVVEVNPSIFPSKTLTGPKVSKRKIAGETVHVSVSPHNGQIPLPENGNLPAQLVSFASSYDRGTKSFLVTSLPSIWKSSPNLKDEKNLEILVRGVFVHEMTHTHHRNFYQRLDDLEKLLPKSENMDDDIIQNTFGKNETFRTAVEAERLLLAQAVDAVDRAAKRRIGREFFKMMSQRRADFFIGDKAFYGEIEEIFLTMEGTANWAAYRSAIGEGLSSADALKLVRRSGKYWSQDEGMMLFLLIDSLAPGWQKQIFANEKSSVLRLLENAVK